MKTRTGGAQKEQPTEGNFFARVVGLSDLGMQPAWIWQGETVEPQYKIEITYELVTENMADGRPFWVSEEMKNSDNEKAKLYSRCLSAGADVHNLPTLLTKPVMVTIKRDEKGYGRIKNVAGVPTGIPVPELRNSTQLFDIYSDTPDLDMFESFSEFKKDKFKKALDFKETALFRALAESDGQF